MSSIIILGAGFGGLTAANELKRLLGDKHAITLIDKKDNFSVSAMNLWVMIGKKKPEECARHIREIESKGIKFVNDTIVRIDTDEKKVFTTTDYYRYDYLIISLGAEYAEDLIPGFKEMSLNLYDINGSYQISQQIEKFYRGKILITIPRLPIKCPGAPYETAFLLDSYMKEQGRRSNVTITICTAEPYPLPSAGKACGNMMIDMLNSRNIKIIQNAKILAADKKKSALILENGIEEGFDLLIGIPPHFLPTILKNFADETSWIPVDRQTLKTKFQNVFAIGDSTSIKLSNGMALPKAGVFAEEEAKIVADIIACDIDGKKSEKTFDGKGYCFLEIGDNQAAKIVGEFFEPEPIVEIIPPSKEIFYEKVSFVKRRMDELV